MKEDKKRIEILTEEVEIFENAAHLHASTKMMYQFINSHRSDYRLMRMCAGIMPGEGENPGSESWRISRSFRKCWKSMRGIIEAMAAFE
jgi:hypothetical protein